MQNLPNVQNQAIVVWDGANSFPIDISGHIQFGFSFQVVATVATDAVFKVQSAPASIADDCVPGAFTDVDAVPICRELTPGALATFTVNAGTPIKTVCPGTIPCRPNKFLRLVSVSGPTANVKVCAVLQGPKSI
jgi:hypothetical protein